MAEQEFEKRYRRLLRGQEFSLADLRAASNETDYLVLDRRKRPAFRINVKSHGTFFQNAEREVQLQPEDTFALATYKIRDANRRSLDEALPFLFAVISSEALGAASVGAKLPPEIGHICDVRSMFRDVSGARALERALVARMLDPAHHGRSPLIEDLRKAVVGAEWRVISAPRAEDLFERRKWERVPAIARRNFSGDRDSQPNMHFSLSEDMSSLDEFFAILNKDGIQHVATKIAYRQI